jgi:glucan phosphoethanolaminetransferase (alkaline phosphatase superfamily)
MGDSTESDHPVDRTGHNHFSHVVCDGCKYDPFIIRLVYIFASVFWIAILAFIDINPLNAIDWFIIILPLILFAIAAGTADKITPYAEANVLRAGTIQNIVILLLPILIWATARVDNKPAFLLLILVATGLSILSVIDVWVTERYLGIIKHLRSIAQTLSIALVLLALVQYYQDRRNAHFKRVTGETDGGTDDIEVMIAANM